MEGSKDEIWVKFVMMDTADLQDWRAWAQVVQVVRRQGWKGVVEPYRQEKGRNDSGEIFRRIWLSKSEQDGFKRQ